MSDGYIVVSLEGGDEVELESDKEGKFSISCLNSLAGTTVSGLKYLSTNSRYRGVRVDDGELLEPNDGWQSETRIYQVVLNRSDLEKNSQQNTGIQQPACNSDAIACCNVISNERSHKGTRVCIA